MKEFLQKFKEAESNPSLLSDLHMSLAHHFGEVSWDYEQKVPLWAVARRRLVQEYKTVARAEFEFDNSDYGVDEKQIKTRLKSLEKLLSAIKRRMETLDNESRNQY